MHAMPALNSLVRDLLAGISDMPLPAPVPATAPAPVRKRTKLWELEAKHHCPVIGTCLRMEDLLRFARRYRFGAEARNEFALHVETVSCCQSRNAVSEALQKFLDRKYEGTVTRFARLKTDAEVRAEWQACQQKGEIAGPMWAAYTHKAASAATRDAVYADVHMLSHQVGAGLAADTRRLGFLENENTELKRSLDAEWSQHQSQAAKLNARITGLEASLRDRTALLDELGTLRERIGHYESGTALAQLTRKLVALERAGDQLETAMQRIAELEKSLQAAQQQATDATLQRDAAHAERDALERLLVAEQPEPASCDLQCGCCESAGSRRCVLYVGGRASLVSQYRELAERLGVRLVHHDGGQEEALSRLPELIRSADAVICPTDCVSHSAYYNLKQHCKRSGKPCLFFKGAGVASFAVAMARVGKGEFSLAGQLEPASPLLPAAAAA